MLAAKPIRGFYCACVSTAQYLLEPPPLCQNYFESHTKSIWQEMESENEEERSRLLPPKEEDEESEKSVDEEDDKKIKPKGGKVWKLFSYATPLDILLMMIGAVGGILHGAILPLFMIIFGNSVNYFIYQQITYNLEFLNNGSDLECNAVVNSYYLNETISEATNKDLDCPYVITSTSTLATIIDVCYQSMSECTNNDKLIDKVNNLALKTIIFGTIVLVFGSFQVTFFQAACERQLKRIRLAFYKAIISQEIGFFDANSTGELSSRISDDVDKIHRGMGEEMGMFVQWSSTAITGFAVAFIKEWRLALLLIAFFPLLVISGFTMTQALTLFASKEQKQYAAAGGVAEEILSSVKTVAAFGGEEKECERYESKLKEARLIGAKKGTIVGLNYGVVYGLLFLMNATSFWFGSYLIQEGYANAGKVLTTTIAIYIGGFAVGQAGPSLESVLIAAGASEVIFEIIDKKSLIDPFSDEGDKPETFDVNIEFKDIYFTYPTRPDVPVMDGFNLKVEAGKTYALVGPSGCGKSTVIQLLQRFYDPDGGEVLVGGKDVRSLNVKWLRQHIGVVSQEPVLFDTTIAENILYGKEGATTEEVKDAAKNANAHDFISKLPDGYNTFVGEGGTQLSGGQKQRIAIARALIRDPKILLLDEATSALDTESESIVQQALDNALTGRTTIVIAHRLSTIQNADVIASIQDGRVVEMGNHLELMDKEGLYYELVTAQALAADVDPEMIGRKSKLSSSVSRRSISVSEPVTTTPERRISLHKQLSIKTEQEIVSLEKKQEEWDKEIPKVPLIRLIKLNAPEWWIIALGILAVFVTGSLMPSFAPILGQAIGVFSKPPDKVLHAIHPWAIVFVVLAGFSLIFYTIKSLCFSVSGENLTSRLRTLSFKAMLRQEMAWFDEERNSSSALTYQLADDTAKVQGATGSYMGNILEVFFGMVVSILISFIYSWALTLLILGLIPLIVITNILRVQALAGHSATNKKAMESAGKIAVESISHIRTVASISLEENFNRQYTKYVEKPYRKALLSSLTYGLTYGFSQALIFYFYVVIVRFGAHQITLDDSNILHSTYKRMFVVFFAVVIGGRTAGHAGAYAPNYAKARLSANRIFYLLDRKPRIDSYSEEGKKLEKVTGEVATDELHFVYPSRPDVHVLQGLDISVKSGQTLALVGPSGCGKSTVVSLLERFYDPVSGILTLDDIDISELNIQWLRNQIGLVSQEPVLFDRSIAENISYGANFREVSFEEITEAAKAANIHKFVESLPQGYKTNVGVKGTQISGGQKQRIAIARALIRDPKVLLLDEATSALDTESEKIVQEALDQAREGRTCIVIAHRLSTIYNSDCIVVISGGKAVEKGTHQELMDKKGIYYKLNSMQQAGVDD